MAFIEIKPTKGGTYYFQGGTPLSAFQAFQKQVGGRASYKSISQSAFNTGLSKFGFSPSGAPAAKKPVAPKPKKTAPSTADNAKAKAAAAINKKASDFAKKQSAEAKVLENQFKAYLGGLTPLEDLRGEFSEELGIGELQAQLEPLRKRALSLGLSLTELPGDVEKRTRGSLVTESQRRLLEQKAGTELESQLRNVAISQEFFAGQLGGAQEELAARLGLTQTQRDFDLRAFGQQADQLNTRLAREITGYTQELQREFEALIGDITDARQLTRDEQQRAFELAMLEKSAILEANNIKLKASLSGPTSAQTGASQSKQAEGIFKSQITGIKAKTPSGVGDVFPRFAVAALLEGGNLQNIYDIWAEFSGFGPALESPAKIISLAKGQAPGGGSSFDNL